MNVPLLIIGVIFVIFGGVAFAFGIATSNLTAIVAGLIAAAVGFYANKPNQR